MPASSDQEWIPTLDTIKTDNMNVDVLPKSVIITGQSGAGKAVSVDTLVLTTKGYKRAGSVDGNDLLFSQDGDATEILGIYPQGVRDAYRVTFNDSTSVVVDGDHLWQVMEKNNRATNQKWQVLTTKEIMTKGVATDGGSLKWYIPMTKPVQFHPLVDLPIDPYVLGVMLGDGNLTNSTTTVDTHPWICEKIAELANVSKRVGGQGCQKASILGVSDAIRDLGLDGKRSYEKHIPDAYLYAEAFDRLRLLHGLMDTDGTPQHSGGTEYSTTSAALKDGVVWLAQSLGGTARVGYKAEPRYTHKGETRVGRPCWRVNVKLPAWLCPFTLPEKVDKYIPPSKYPPARKIASIEPAGECAMVCFKVAANDGLFLVNDCIVTHNTTLAATAFGDISKHLTGKTSKRHTLPGAVWLLTDEQGIVSLRVRGIMPEYLIDFRDFVVKAGGHVGKALQWTHDMLDQTANAGATTVIVDTITSLGAYLERYYVHGAGCPKSNGGDRNPLGGWGIVANKQFELYETISELNLRALWLAHPQENRAEEAAEARKATETDKAKAIVSGTAGDNWIVPAMSGQKFRKVVTGQCCISGWLRASFVNGKRVNQWMPFGGDGSQGKNRYENILDREEPADLYLQDQKILNHVNKE